MASLKDSEEKKGRREEIVCSTIMSRKEGIGSSA